MPSAAVVRPAASKQRKGRNVDECRFDGLARNMAAASTRRATLKVLGGGAAASLLALVGRGAAAQEITDEGTGCRSTGSHCDKDKKCCSKRCTAGLCICRARGQKCRFGGRRRNKACCSGKCKGNGKCA